MATNTNPVATALKQKHLNEVTVTIMNKDKNVNYHETFMLDTSIDNSFEFDGDSYKIPAEDTMHYHPSFWKWDVKLGMYFERHKLIAKFLDWLNFKEKAVFEIGFLYWKGQSDPVPIIPQEWNQNTLQWQDFDMKHDWAIQNFNLMKNTTFKGKRDEIANLYRKPGISVKSWMIFAII